MKRRMTAVRGLRHASGICLATSQAVALLAAAPPVSALDYPLSDTAVRSAFMTGNNKNDRTAELFLKYAHSFPAPAAGPHVASIILQTPYEQIAELGATTVTDYHAQEAEQDFRG